MQRKLTAILSADVVGYSGLMEADETGTLERLKANRAAIFDPHVANHGGRVFKLMGDGALVEFSSAVAAVHCALAIQEATERAEPQRPPAKRVRYRIGINLGEVIVEGDDIYGEGVNVAARLQALAPVGGVSLSRLVHDQVNGKLPCEFEDMGEHIVKNIQTPVHVFSVRATGHIGAHSDAESQTVQAPRKLSVCVLPFANMSGDLEQEYFSDGISEDIITDLSKVSALSVVSRNSSFMYKGKNVDLPKVARELNVSHILEGSVRKSSGRVRITAQLIDGATNAHVWADRYDRDLNDIFALQDEISEAIVKALKLKLLPEEKNAIQQRGTNNIEAYNLYLRARQIYLAGNSGTSRGNQAVLRLCTGALKIDAEYARAWALMALVQALQATTVGGSDDDGLATAERALALDWSLSEAHAAKARALINLEKYDSAREELDTALRLDPESYEANVSAGILCWRQQRLREAIGYFEKGAALNKTGFFNLGRLTSLYVEIGDAESARRTAQLALVSTQGALSQEPDNGTAMGHMAYALAVLDERERTIELVRRGRLLDPLNNQMKVYFVRALVKLLDVEDALDLLDEMLQTAGRSYFVILSTPHFDPLRAHPRFKAMIAAAEARLAAPS
jgi:adenylate cyclase